MGGAPVVIVLGGLIFPILLLLAAIVFDIGVVLWFLFRWTNGRAGLLLATIRRGFHFHPVPMARKSSG